MITEGGDEMATIALGEIGPSGRWQRMTFFDPEQLHEALDQLDEWWVESGGPGAVARADIAVRRAYRLGSPAMLRSVLSDDFDRIGYTDGTTETISKGEVFHLRSGHNSLRSDGGVSYVEFSPAEEQAAMSTEMAKVMAQGSN